jgi:sugar phosphate isomerase/epimerase
MDAAGFLRHLAAEGFDGHIVLEINTRKAGTRAERESDLRESLAFAREHFVVAAEDAAP